MQIISSAVSNVHYEKCATIRDMRTVWTDQLQALGMGVAAVQVLLPRGNRHIAALLATATSHSKGNIVACSSHKCITTIPSPPLIPSSITASLHTFLLYQKLILLLHRVLVLPPTKRSIFTQKPTSIFTLTSHYPYHTNLTSNYHYQPSFSKHKYTQVLGLR